MFDGRTLNSPGVELCWNGKKQFRVLGAMNEKLFLSCIKLQLLILDLLLGLDLDIDIDAGAYLFVGHKGLLCVAM